MSFHFTLLKMCETQVKSRNTGKTMHHLNLILKPITKISQNAHNDMWQSKDLNCFCTISYIISVIPAAGLPYYESLFKDCNDLDSNVFE